jgi:hypothetical protein
MEYSRTNEQRKRRYECHTQKQESTESVIIFHQSCHHGFVSFLQTGNQGW